MSFEGFLIGPQNEEGISDITCLKCGVTLPTLTKHLDIIKTLRCGNCGYKSFKSDIERRVKS